MKTTIKNIFITIGLVVLSQVSMTTMGMISFGPFAKGRSILMPTNLLMILLTLANITVMIFIAKHLGIARFKWDFLTKKNVGLIFLLFFIGRIIAVIGTLLLQNQGIASTANDASIAQLFSNISPWVTFLLVSIAAPIMEEIVFRGALIGLVFKKHQTTGLIVSALIFGCLHGPTDWISFVIYTSLGFILGYAYLKSRRLEVSISVHFLNNLLSGIAFFFI